MLHRAASNAYSWWWASHIRTKQSKWLDQNLQDMEEKVQAVLKLIEEDGDSFAKRAEMYYKKRPELINFVEESYRAYRALAERYDHISTELQNANNTIAYVFPEQVQFAMEDDEDEAPPRFPKKLPEAQKANNIPKVPKIPKDLKNALTSAAFAKKLKKPPKGATATTAGPNSGLSKSEGLKVIDRLQKQILALQTEKEFAKSSYEGGLAKYWEIETQITEMQEKVFSLQDEFGAGVVIEDDEARTLMASAALRSCQQTLAQLQEKQERSAGEAAVQCRRIDDVRHKLRSIKHEFSLGEINLEEPQASEETAKAVEDLESLHEKIKEEVQVESNASLTVTEIAEKIDELVNKVISLEASVSSQTALIQRLSIETDDLLSQIRTLEDEKATLIHGKNDLIDTVREMEEKLRGIQELNHNVEDQNRNLHKHFTEAGCSLDHLSEKMHNIKPDEELQLTPKTEDTSVTEIVHLPNVKPEQDPSLSDSSNKEFILAKDIKEQGGKPDDHNVSEDGTDKKTQELVTKEPAHTIDLENDHEPDLKKLLMSGLEDKEKILLKEYTTVLRNYKDVKKKLIEAEKKDGDRFFDTALKIKELKSVNAKKDEQIQFLLEKLNLLQAGLGDDQVSEKLTVIDSSEKVPAEDIHDDTTSEIEQKFRASIDELLEENLEYWLRFSDSFHQIQKFDTEVKDLQSEFVKIQEKQMMKDGGGSSTVKYYLKSDAKPLYKHLREIYTELSVWLEKTMLLKAELKSRFSSLCEIQQEITNALTESAEDDDIKFTSYQAAKFQGEILNMKQENSKVGDELQAGLDHVTTLQQQVDKTLAKLNEEFKLSGSKHHQSNIQLQHTESRSRVPLRSFIFGTKTRKPRHSLFSYVHPALHKKHSGLKSSRSTTANM